MSVHVILNSLNELMKRDTVRGLPSILSLFRNMLRGLPSIVSLFRNKFNKFNKTWAQMLDSIYHMLKSFFWPKMLGFCHICDIKSVIS